MLSVLHIMKALGMFYENETITLFPRLYKGITCKNMTHQLHGFQAAGYTLCKIYIG